MSDTITAEERDAIVNERNAWRDKFLAADTERNESRIRIVAVEKALREWERMLEAAEAERENYGLEMLRLRQSIYDKLTAKLEAAIAERDALKAEINIYRKNEAEMAGRIFNAHAERDAARTEVAKLRAHAAIGAKVEAMPPLTTLGRSEAGDWFCRKPLDLSVGTMWADTPLAALAALEAAQEPKCEGAEG